MTTETESPIPETDAETEEAQSIHPLRSRLGRRIVFILVLISGTITFLATLTQLYFDYSQQFNNVDKRHLEIRNIHTHLLASSLWNFDLTILQQRMNGLINLPYIDYLEIKSDDYKISAGKPVTGRKTSNVYPLTFQDPITGKSEKIGTILVESNVQQIYDSLLNDFLVTLAINAAKTTLVCYLILIVFHHSINQRIFSIVRYLRQYNPRHRTHPLKVRNYPIITQKNDELSLLCNETNKLTKNLAILYQNIRFEQARLADFAHVSSDWLWETDASLKLIYCSEGMLEALHLEESHHLTFNQIEQFHAAVQLQQFLNEKQNFQHCEVALTLNGHQRWLMFQAQARYNNDDHEFLGFRGTALNITELKSVQSELETLNQSLENTVQERTQDLAQSLKRLKQAQAQLIQSEKLAALGGLVAGVAHEVNTPLGIAVTATSIIEEVTEEFESAFRNQTLTTDQFVDLTGRLKSGSELLQSNLGRASKLIRDFKQTAVDQVSESRSKFNIHQVIMALIASMHPETRKIPVTPQLEGDENLMMNSLPGILTQIVSNLIMNSIVHAFEGEHPSPIIHIKFYAEAQNIILEYQDNGIGVPHELHEKIFEPFYTSKRGYGGSGLGLNLVFNLVTQKLKGTLQFTSEPGQGVHYRIQLPKTLD
ncbi:sensor histidine kinase [Vibrio mangrovi]|uniref:histidine kinase n=1 Tax=Vibrio mangrovi TaxID=474394 RepID=A0A1Y6IVE1_9VIBR|nr:ATP-binding protein [Vibrio mangrovi]MDW6004877.1 ATP-binding protein [Vibrio mangrovi]SMS01639.1 Globin-coupled histidine kinase [Vibrio mangrovi]